MAENQKGKFIGRLTFLGTVFGMLIVGGVIYYLLIQNKTNHTSGDVSISEQAHFEAIAGYDAEIRHDPENLQAYYNRAMSKFNLGHYSAAIRDFDNVIQLFEGKPNLRAGNGILLYLAYTNRGVSKSNLEQYPAAIVDYSVALQIDASAYPYYMRAWARYHLGEHFGALLDCDRAVEFEPNNSDAYWHRGRIKSNLGNQFDAISDYNIAIQLNPSHGEAYLSRALAKKKLGHSNAASDDFDRATELADKVRNTELKDKIFDARHPYAKYFDEESE